MPRRGPGWTPKLSHFPLRKCGRVRIPGRGTIYLGKTGCWASARHKPPSEVVEAYEREVARWLAAKGEGREALPAAGCTIGELADAYHCHCEKVYRKRGRPTSHVRLIGKAVYDVVTLFGSQPAADFSPADLRIIRAKLEREGRLNRRTINYQLGRIKRMFRWGVEEELIPEDVWLRLKVVGGLQKHRTSVREPGKVKPVNPNLVEKTLPELPEVVAAMVRLQQIIGARPEEVCYLRAGDITEEGDLWRYDVRDDANKLAHRDIARTIYLGPRAQKILKPWLLKARLKGPDEWVFPKRIGKGPQTPRRYWAQIQEACERAGVERWSPNRLRHLRLTLTREKYDREGAQAQGGHMEPLTTEGYSSEALREIAKRIARETG